MKTMENAKFVEMKRNFQILVMDIKNVVQINVQQNFEKKHV